MSEAEKKLSPAEAANKALDDAKDQFEAVLTIGVTKEGKLDVITNLSSFPHMQWMLQRAGLELLLVERDNSKSDAPAE